MKNKLLLIILILLLSCSLNNKKNQDPSTTTSGIAIKKIYSYENNNFEVLIDYNISNSHFVFKKELESFEAHMLITVQVFDINSNTIIQQDSWNDVINTRYYECGTGEPLLLLHGGEIGAGSSLDIFSFSISFPCCIKYSPASPTSLKDSIILNPPRNVKPPPRNIIF